jgi:hypothetical protein
MPMPTLSGTTNSSTLPPGRWWSKPGVLRAGALVLFLGASVAFLLYQTGQVPRSILGDDWEYWYQTETFYRHGTPDLRPADIAAVNAEAQRLGMPTPPERPYAYLMAPDQNWYSIHFWAYAISAIPAKFYLETTGWSELAALRLANSYWFVAALAVVLFVSRAPVGQRIALAVLASVGPCFWHIRWQGAEMFCWSLVLMGVVAFRDRRYAWCALAAGLAATQNPPIILFAGIAVLMAGCDRRWGQAGLAVAGMAVGLIPFAVCKYLFGVPSLIIYSHEYAGIRNLSWVRTWGLATDLNQGLLPYMPLLVIGAAIGFARMLWTKNARGLALAGALVATALGLQVAHNWNSGCDRIHRYLVWIIPLAAGVAVEGIGGRWRLWVFAGLAACIHLGIFFAYDASEDTRRGFLWNMPIADQVLNDCPELYWADPEIFIERHQHTDGWPYIPADFPVCHVRPDGTVSKMLLDPGSVEKVNERYQVDPAFMEKLRGRAASESVRFYSHPPYGAVRVK